MVVVELGPLLDISRKISILNTLIPALELSEDTIKLIDVE